MIRGIVAIDEKRGMATASGIPWKLPTDGKFFSDSIRTGIILMGYGTYVELKKPFHDRVNFVATRDHAALRDGFMVVADPAAFIASAQDDVWVIGGPGLLTSTLGLLDELHITQLQGDFGCTKFLPDYHDMFTLKKSSEPLFENAIQYTFEVWQRTTN